MTIAGLVAFAAAEPDFGTRWRLVGLAEHLAMRDGEDAPSGRLSAA